MALRSIIIEKAIKPILDKFDIKLSEIKAITGETPRTLSNLYDMLKSLRDDVFGIKEAYSSFTDPTTNPTLDLDLGIYGRPFIEVWAKSLTGGATVRVYGSRNGTDWRLVDTLTTDVDTREVHKGYNNAYRYVRVVIVETGTGTAEIEISAGR